MKHVKTRNQVQNWPQYEEGLRDRGSLTVWLGDHTTISRHKAKLGKVALGETQNGRPIHILIDSSGLSVHVRLYRKPPKNRDYRKLRIYVDK